MHLSFIIISGVVDDYDGDVMMMEDYCCWTNHDEDSNDNDEEIEEWEKI